MIVNPFFSIIIPTYARPRSLAACLRALAGLHYPRARFEVVVVDDGSETPPRDVIASFEDAIDLTLLVQRHAGPAAARNHGAAQARGPFLAFTDDDCAPAPGWLEALAAHLVAAPDHLVGGQTRNALAGNPYATASQLLIDYLYAAPQQTRFFAANNMALSAAQFHAVGGFDPTFARAAGEDREFCDRWQHNGYPMAYVPAAVVYHAHALTGRTFWRQHFNYGRGALRFHRARARRRQSRLRIEPISFYLGLLRYPFSQMGGWRALRLTALLAVSQAANAAGFFWGNVQAR